jgi:hypothetical protein
MFILFWGRNRTDCFNPLLGVLQIMNRVLWFNGSIIMLRSPKFINRELKLKAYMCCPLGALSTLTSQDGSTIKQI